MPTITREQFDELVDVSFDGEMVTAKFEWSCSVPWSENPDLYAFDGQLARNGLWASMLVLFGDDDGREEG